MASTSWFIYNFCREYRERLKGASKDLEQAMDRLNFYINRAGKNIDAKTKKVLDNAKKELDKLYGKNESVQEAEEMNGLRCKN